MRGVIDDGRGVGGRRMRGVIVVHHVHRDETDGVEERGNDERAAQTDEAGEHAADDGPDGGTETLRRLHQADCRRHAIAGRRFSGHRDRQRSIAREQSLHGTQREHVPRARHQRHRRHQHDEARHRSLDHQLAPVAIAELPPCRREDRREAGRHTEADASPDRDVADIGDAQLTDEERKKRHHEREARVPHEARSSDGVDVTLPAAARSVHAGCSAPGAGCTVAGAGCRGGVWVR